MMSESWRRTTMLFAAVLFLVLGLTGCTRGEVELKNTVSAYIQMLTESLAKPDAAKMKFFASQAEIARIDSYILFMLKEKKVLNSTMQKLDFRGVEIDKDQTKATVTAYEEWTYHYVDEKSRQPISKEEAIAYNNVYHLIKDQGHWVVDKIDSNETQSTTTPAPAEPAGAKPPAGDNSGGIRPSGKF
ncbi:hypothetical protein OR1_02499 [Geobacter sp. OR-1]|nr:hypothetical protein OR1_02499 [Geobacter sp. OR-1]